MKILAKSILKPEHLDARAKLGVDGIEFLLLERNLHPDNIGATLGNLKRVSDKFGLVALELPDSFGEFPVDPVTRDDTVRRASRDFLARGVELANRLHDATGRRVPYLQYQLIINNPFDGGIPIEFDRRDELLSRIAAYHKTLARESSVPLQIENAIPINPSFAKDRLYHCFVTTRLEDLAEMDITAAFDIVHFAQSLYTWALAVGVGNRPAGAYSEVQTPKGTFYIQMTEEDIRRGKSVAATLDTHSVWSRAHPLPSRITEIINHETGIYFGRIGSLQFANAPIGTGVSNEDAGQSGNGGMINVDDVLRIAVRRGVPYLIPEYREVNYANPVNQRNAIEMLRQIITQEANSGIA